MKKLMYLLTSHGRFHYFELAKILNQRNQLHKIISGYPWFSLKREKIPKKFVKCFGLFSTLNFLHRKSKYQNQTMIENIDIFNCKNVDRMASKNINQADVLLSLSETGLNTGKEMKKKNKIYICDRNSAHILEQQQILSDEHQRLNLPKFEINQWFIDRELNEYEESDIILVPSSFVKKTFEKFYTKKVKVITFPTYQRFKPEQKVKKDKKFFNVLFIGSLSIRKGLHYLIEAFHKLNYPNKRLHIVGRNTQDKFFFDKILSHDKILVHGHVDNLKMKEIINNCDVCVLPSLEDGFGMTPLQAMSCGCPVIISENTGSADIIKANNCGFVVPTGNSTAIAEKLTLLQDNKHLLDELSYNAYKASITKTWENYIDELDQFIINFKENRL